MTNLAFNQAEQCAVIPKYVLARVVLEGVTILKVLVLFLFT